MNKRIFILALVIIAFALVGWFYYVSSQAQQAKSIDVVSVDWWGSAHADETAEAFIHWNEDEPAEVPVNCAKCHSGQGLLDYIGQDGSTAFSVDAPGRIDDVISCEVCHNEQANVLHMAFFPSGAEISLQTGDALCATCHSGTTSGTRIDTVAEGFLDDDVIPDASFITPHYAHAAATLFGSEAQSGYQYEGKNYTDRFDHADGVQTCTDCHDPHSLHMKDDYEGADLCAACHSNVSDYSDYRNVFVDGIDYDGDGTIEGVYHEIEGTRNVLYAAIQTYAATTLDQSIGWADQYPYLFIDTNENFSLEEDEVAFPNQYATFSPRLLRAAFNYQFSIKESAGYVHNGKYILQLLNDSIQDLAQNTALDLPPLIRPE
jgi:hypothetical protein